MLPIGATHSVYSFLRLARALRSVAAKALHEHQFMTISYIILRPAHLRISAQCSGTCVYAHRLRFRPRRGKARSSRLFVMPWVSSIILVVRQNKFLK